ncbi:MAG TPA: hypothetical protein VFE47_20605 [Tepidisphaeraceae bacterium]|nr:hypothetical protein [Tepidisphaeraceae bacterium]
MRATMFRSISPFCFVIIAVSCLSIAADEKPAATQPAAGEVTDGCQISVSISPAECAVGEPIILTINFTNLGPPVKLRGIGPVADYDIIVLRASGARAPYTVYGESGRDPKQALGIYGTVLDCGASDMVRVHLNRCFDMSFSTEYRIHVERKMPSRPDPEKMVTIVSNTVTAKLAEPNLADPEDTKKAE